MATPTTPYRFNPTRVIIEVKDDIPPPDSTKAEEEGVEVDVDEILNEQPAEEPAKETPMTKTAAPDAATDAPNATPGSNHPTLNVREHIRPPEMEKPMTSSKPPFFKFGALEMSGRLFCTFLLFVAMAATIMWLLLGTGQSRRVPPPVIVTDGEPRVMITPTIVDSGTTKPVVDMGSTTPPSRTPAAAAPPLTTTPVAPAPATVYTYQVQASDFVLAIMMACDEKQAESDATKWFEDNNPDIKNVDVLRVDQIVNVPCKIKQGAKNKVWQMRQTINRQRKAAKAKNSPPVKPTPQPAVPPVIVPAPPATPTAPAAPAKPPAADGGGVPAAVK